MTAKIDETGNRYGRLAVVCEAAGGKRVMWLCNCDCGARDVRVQAGDLRSGHTKSCGCLAVEAARRKGHANATHGESSHGGRDASAEYSAWSSMIQRCTNQKGAGYHRYGGRGIAVCDRWRTSYETFLADMGRRPSPQHSVDRKDNDGNYEPGNCRWATVKEQGRNRRTNHTITARGRTATLIEWAELSGIRAGTIYERLRRGWSDERAVFTPVKQ